jgi:methylthioribose-1-phosphate isomerase
VNLSWATRRVLDAVGASPSGNPAELRTVALAEAQRIADEDVDVNRRMGTHGAEVVPPQANILTHCNAGSLATVDYGTTLGVVRAAVERANRSTFGWMRRDPACRARA